MARVLVSGGSGFLGGEVVRRAAARGDDVVGTWWSHEPAPVAGVTWARVDGRDRRAVDALVGDVGPDAVVHTAYVQGGPDLRAVTTEGSAHLAVAARRAGARLVHLSTDVVFSGTTDRPYREDDPVAPVHDYGRAKAAAEARVTAADPGAVLVRTSLLYRGPVASRPPSRHEQDVLDAVDGTTDAAFFTDEWRNPVLVDDLAAALLELAGRPEVVGPLHVAGPDAVTRFELAQLVAAAFGRDPQRVRGATSASIVPARPRDCRLDTSLAARTLDTRVRGVREVLGAGPPGFFPHAPA